MTDLNNELQLKGEKSPRISSALTTNTYDSGSGSDDEINLLGNT